jgi:hypothetical protein
LGVPGTAISRLNDAAMRTAHCLVVSFEKYLACSNSELTIIDHFKLVSSKRNTAVKSPCDLAERLWYPKQILVGFLD